MDIFQEKLQNTPKEIKSHLITLPPPKAQGSSHKSGHKNCKRQRYWMFSGHGRPIAHMNSQ